MITNNLETTLPLNKSQQSIFPLLWVMLLDHTCLNIAFPVLTLLFFDLQTNLFPEDTSLAVRSMWYGLCVSLPHLINIIMTPILSALSDEFGRKRILMMSTIGAFLFAMTAAFGILLGSLTLLFTGRIIQGVFSRTNPIAQAAIGDLIVKNKKVLYMGYLQTSISLGAFIGPVLGGYFANRFLFSTFNFSFPYFVAALFAALATLVAVFSFKETLAVKRNYAPWRGLNTNTIKNVISNKKVLSISFVLLLSQISWSLYYQYIPPTLKTELNFDAHLLGIFVGMIAFWLAMATTFGIKILDRFLSFRQMLIGSVYFILFGLVMTFLFCYFHTSNNLLVWIAAIPTAMGDVIAYSCLTTLYSDAVKPCEQGKVMAMCFIVVSLIWALTGMLGGILMSINSLLPMIVSPIGTVGAIFVLHSRIGKSLVNAQSLA